MMTPRKWKLDPRPIKSKAWLVVNPEISNKLQIGDFVRYRGRWHTIYWVTEDNGIQLSNFKYVCITKLDDWKH